MFRVPENPSGSYITVHLQLHFFPSSCFIVHIQPCCRQWAGDGTVRRALFIEKTLLTSSHMAQRASARNHKKTCGLWLALMSDARVLLLLAYADQKLYHSLLLGWCLVCNFLEIIATFYANTFYANTFICAALRPSLFWCHKGHRYPHVGEVFALPTDAALFFHHTLSWKVQQNLSRSRKLQSFVFFFFCRRL